jgi:HD-GYP domain-containing protein (c-di-GMP phosphodiesterase class II)
MTLARRIFLNHHKYSRAEEGLKDTLFGLIHCLTEALEAKDPYTSGHSERVARIALRLAQEMGLAADLVGNIYLAGLLHDVGKIGVRDSVLLKPGRLTDEEMGHVRAHTVIGDRLVARIRQLEHLRPGVRNHHERYDGTGYPDALAGEAIPLLARILAVADSCDALMADRPYRRALPPAAIDEVMRAGAGKQWDPEVIVHFLACRHELYPICQRGIGESVFRAVTSTVNAAVNEASQENRLPESGAAGDEAEPFRGG